MATDNEASGLSISREEYLAHLDQGVSIYTGCALFLAGIGLGVIGVATSLYGLWTTSQPLLWASIIAGMLAVPMLLSGIVVLLSIDRRPRLASAAGLVLCGGAALLFVVEYVLPTSVFSPHSAVAVIAVYSLGSASIMGATGAALFAYHVAFVREGVPDLRQNSDASMAEGSSAAPSESLVSRLIWVKRPERILVVDDDDEFRELLKHSLKAAGFAVETTGDANECLERVSTNDPPLDAVLLDLSMPGLDGFETLKRIEGGDDPVPVIVISGRTGEREEIRAFELGAVDFIEKPVNINVLTTRVERHLRRDVTAT